MANVLFGWLFIVIGVGGFGIAVVVLVRTVADRRRRHTWLPVTARIDEVTSFIDRGPESYPHRRYVTHYSYRAPDGSEHRDSRRIDNQRIREDAVGRPLDIVVDPRAPERSLVVGEEPFLGCAVIGMLFPVLLGVVFAWGGSMIASGRL